MAFLQIGIPPYLFDSSMIFSESGCLRFRIMLWSPCAPPRSTLVQIGADDLCQDRYLI